MDGDALDATVFEIGDFGQQARMAVPILVDLRSKLGNVHYDELIDEALEKIRAEKPPALPSEESKDEKEPGIG
jgi:hypothetical protein